MYLCNCLCVCVSHSVCVCVCVCLCVCVCACVYLWIDGWMNACIIVHTHHISIMLIDRFIVESKTTARLWGCPITSCNTHVYIKCPKSSIWYSLTFGYHANFTLIPKHLKCAWQPILTLFRRTNFSHMSEKSSFRGYIKKRRNWSDKCLPQLRILWSLAESSPYTQYVEGVVSSPHHRSRKRSLLVKGSMIRESLPTHAPLTPQTHIYQRTDQSSELPKHKVVLFVYCFDLFTRCRGNTEWERERRREW